MVSKYEKLNSQLNVYPFKTCPYCGLTYAVMGDSPKKAKNSYKPLRRTKTSNQYSAEDDENNRSMMISIDDFEDFPTDELVDDVNEFLLVDILDKADCGKTKFYNETFEHKLYCARYKAAKKKYHPHVLDYKDRCYLENKLIPVLRMSPSLTTKELLINNLCEIYFTESLEMCDFSLSHPHYQEFVNLLWNTKWFLKQMREYLSQNELERFKSRYPVNNGLRKGLRWWTNDKDEVDYGDNNDENEDYCFDVIDTSADDIDMSDIEEFF